MYRQRFLQESRTFREVGRGRRRKLASIAPFPLNFIYASPDISSQKSRNQFFAYILKTVHFIEKIQLQN